MSDFSLTRSARELSRAALCTACLCLLAPVSLPIGPVSLTLGLFAVQLAGALLPPALAAASAAVYLLLGFAGLPVFAGGLGGPGVLFGVTGGFLLAYPLSAAVFSMGCRRFSSPALRLAAALAANCCCYLPGTLWFMAAAGLGPLPALSACVLPFVLPDLFKAWCALALARRIRLC